MTWRSLVLRGWVVGGAGVLAASVAFLPGAMPLPGVAFASDSTATGGPPDTSAANDAPWQHATPPPQTSAAGSGVWTHYPSPPSFGTPPEQRVTSSAVYDPVRKRMIVFGGSHVGYLNDTWTLTLGAHAVWAPLATAGTPPPPRRLQRAVYDPVRDRMIVFGGFDGSYFHDTWALTLSGTPTWTPILTATLPPGRADFGMIYDPAGDRVVMFGGYDGDFAHRRGDTWSLNLSGTPDWADLTAPGGPSGRSGHRCAYDPLRGRMLMFGGYDIAFVNDTWAFDLAANTWSPITAAGVPPAPRADEEVVYDPVNDAMIVTHGYDGSTNFSDTRELSLAGAPTWTLMSTAIPPGPRWGAGAVIDPVLNQLVVFGGAVGPVAAGGATVNDTWALTLLGVPHWYAYPLIPAPRASATAVLDAARNRMIVFGGGGDGGYFNDAWTLDLTAAPAWLPLAAAGTPPAGRRLHAAIYDPVRDRMLVFGGYDGTYHNDVWALSLGGTPTWTPLTTVDTPSPRADFACAYDAAHDAMVLFGGYDGAAPRLADSWSLSLATNVWTPIAAVGPTARSGHRGVYDALRHRLIVFGGYDGGLLGDTWALSLDGVPAWSAIATAHVPPSRIEHALVYDAIRDHVVLFGGANTDLSVPDNDLWELPLAGTPDWSLLVADSLPEPRWGPTLIHEPGHDRLVMFGGYRAGFFNDSYSLLRDQPTATEVAIVRTDASGGVVHLMWQGPTAGVTAVLDRAVSEGAWQQRGTVVFDGLGRVSLDDADVLPGVRYRYRLVVSGQPMGETSVTVPISGALAVRAFVAGSALRVECDLPHPAGFSLAVFDVAGRRLTARAFPAGEAGERTVQLECPHASGLVFVQLEQDGRRARAHVVLVR